ncbi:hypothetical protein AVEN_11948-1 [Araneus ventricosus]|uniref:Tc1-like transposase DDE domain-containing protein n=1 Tax=Araneus ventricosus TaxID=182803 RepID=A0A4Y2S598_ARAVE|nr:hypothetical protein AVEN_11948-1 [Araneus ventricosus]
MLSWPFRSPDLLPIEHAWDIIGRQIQHHPQLTWVVADLADQTQKAKHHPQLTCTVADLTDQAQKAWHFIPQNNIRHLYDTMNARLHAYIQNRGDCRGY